MTFAALNQHCPQPRSLGLSRLTLYLRPPFGRPTVARMLSVLIGLGFTAMLTG